jgi:hypothetical protein
VKPHAERSGSNHAAVIPDSNRFLSSISLSFAINII